jgi:hypothetical protein
VFVYFDFFVFVLVLRLFCDFVCFVFVLVLRCFVILFVCSVFMFVL